MRTSGNATLWAIFAAAVVVMLAVDLGVFRKAVKEVSVREAFLRSAVWIAVAAGFNAGIYALVGKQPGLEFTAGYLLEEALSVDNLFVFVVIFSAFRVPAAYQHRILFWGIVGAVLLRGAFIGVGTALVQRFSWVMIVFGVALLYTAWKLFRGDEDDTAEPEKNVAFRLFRRYVPSTPEMRGAHFFVRENGKWLATPLVAVLVLVETSDVLFALDSIPAVFGVTKDPFIVYTSNIFAILGLRSMYFLLSAIVQRFVYLKTGLAIILAFVGGKMVVQQWLHVPTGISLLIIAGVLGLTVAASLLFPPKPKEATQEPH
ncbi:MAG TPA: TerC family protein [Polyangiaceae bacterium]|jgi:tellurite resistance protein TerC|nr:TerC family protein [Polyangiaceae bacterium]